MPNPQQNNGGDEETKIGALAEGFANTATNSTEVDDGAVGYVGAANGDNRNNADNSTDIDVDAKLEVEVGNGNNRDNEYDWSYDSKTISDDDTKTVTITETDTDIKTDYDWSYDSKSYTSTETDTDIKTVTETDTDIKNVTTDDDTTTTGSFNSADSFSKSDDDFATLEDVKDFDNLGIAGGDLNFNLGDDFSFTLDVDDILNGSLEGAGNDVGFSLVQANHLADQDSAYNIAQDNNGAQNHLNANAGDAYGSEGLDLDGKGWDLKAGDDVAGTTTADASAILANSGFHLELVQGANMLSNAVDVSITGTDSHLSSVGDDTSS